jgi:hypothetical protein
LNGTITNTGIIDNSEGGGIGTYYVFDGPSVTHLMTSNNGGGGGSSFSSAIHTAGKPGAGTNQPLVFNSAFRGNRSLVGADDPGNAVYSFGERTLVNDVLALIFKDSYNYAITVPQTFGTTYAFMNEATGVLTVRGGLSNSNDVINVSRQGNEIVVSVNIGNDIAGTGPNGDASDLPAFVSRFPAAGITSIVINGGDGNDSITVSPQVDASITINGGTHSTGDSLNFELAGVADATLVNNGNGTGSLTSTNRQSVTWSNIEVLTPIVRITSANKVYDRTAYAATASLSGANSPAPTVSFVYYSDAGGLNVIAAPMNVGTYFVRAVSGANAGNNASQSEITSFQITPAALVASVTINNKPFDNTTAATIASRSLGGILGADVVTISGGTATFADIGVGNNKTVSATGLVIGGADSGNYTVNSAATALANITATVFNRQVFYNNSGFETAGGNNTPNGVAAALSSNKVLLQSTASPQTTTFASVSNYSRGLNGAVLDIAGLTVSSLVAGDFTFRVAPSGASGVQNPNANWTSPSFIIPTIAVTAGSATIPGRVRLEWPDNAIQNTWVQIIVKANANTGLPIPQTFYIGHAMAEVNGVAAYRVTGADLSAVQAGISNSIVSVNDIRDVNKDRRITGADLSFVQARISNTVLLNNITIPAAGSGEEGSAGSGGGGGGNILPPWNPPSAWPIENRLNPLSFATISDVNQSVTTIEVIERQQAAFDANGAADLDATIKVPQSLESSETGTDLSPEITDEYFRSLDRILDGLPIESFTRKTGN